tara:strand:+ start:60 stop:239 length:180 start_codon:yes stop_codon:yes gene_type:complete
MLESTRALIAGNKTILNKDQVYVMSDDDAKRLISFNIAEEVKEPAKKKQKKVVEPEPKE